MKNFFKRFKVELTVLLFSLCLFTTGILINARINLVWERQDAIIEILDKHVDISRDTVKLIEALAKQEKNDVVE